MIYNSKLLHLTQTIYAFRGTMPHLRPWVGVVVTSQGTVLIDSGNGPAHAADIQTALDQIDAPPVTHILLTHHHWDHVFGNCAFPNAHIVAHEQTQHHLRVMSEELWSDEYIQSKPQGSRLHALFIARIRKAVPDWTEFCVVPAHQTFTKHYKLSLGGYRFTMEHVGGTHEPDQCIIEVQPGNVLFLGDATYGRGPRKEWDVAQLGEELRGFLARRADWYVEGHQPPVEQSQFAKRIIALTSGEPR